MGKTRDTGCSQAGKRQRTVMGFLCLRMGQVGQPRADALASGHCRRRVR